MNSEPPIALFVMLGLVAYLCVFCGFGSYISSTKNRPQIEGAILGAVFGPFGLIVAACLPSNSRTD